jgi:hypothetical protein
MKWVFAVLFIPFFITLAKAQSKRALIIAISNYTYWPHLSSVNDISFISKTLIKQGFEKENIKIVTDENATHAGITLAINNLINDVKAGDVVVIHFSSHGEQIEDDNGDETDGLDETVVSYDALLPDGEGHFKDFQKAQQDYFRDDEFGSLIDKLRTKLGKKGDILVIMDLCHSGTGTRGNTVIRGDKPPGVSLSFDPSKYSRTDTAVFAEASAPGNNEDEMASFVVISASRAEEMDAEIVNNDESLHMHMGSLSYAVSKAFENLDSGTTYQSLFSKIQVIMDDKVQGQHPVMEGNGTNRLLFGGRSVFQKPFVEVDHINSNGIDIRLNAGLLSGLDTGAVISIYPSGTQDPSKAVALATGIVNEAHSYTADVSLNKKIPTNQIAAYWVFVTKPVFNTKPISISIISKGSKNVHPGFSDEEIRNIREGLKEFPLFTFSSDADLILAKGSANDSILVASNGYLFGLVNATSSGLDNLKEKLQRYAQYKFLKMMEVKDPDIHIEVRLVPVINGKADTTKINSRIINGVYEYSIGDKMVVWVKNTGIRPFYFNMLDLQPDGIINAVLPKRDKNIYADDLKINGGSSFLFDRFIIAITPPLGQEILKVFASYDKIDLEDIATSGGKGTRGNLYALERLVGNSYGTASRGVETNDISGAEGLAYDILFRINAKP